MRTTFSRSNDATAAGVLFGYFKEASVTFPDRYARRFAKPILEAIDGATKSLRVKMFLFSDPSILKAVIDAQGRGVNVRIMLNPAGGTENRRTRNLTKACGAGVEVIDSNPEYDVTHEKSMVVDDTTALCNP